MRLKTLKKWGWSVDKDNAFGALLSDFSKTFDCLPHEVLIAKCNDYGLEMSPLRLIYDDLSNRKQRTKIKTIYTVHEGKYCMAYQNGQSLGCFSLTFLVVAGSFF